VARRQLLCSLDQQKRTAAKLRHFMVSEFGIAILPDLLANDLDLGTAAGRVSAERQLYYAGPGNRFWRILHEVGLTPIELQPDNYAKLLDYGIGLTDLAKGACGADINLKPADFDRMRLRSVIKTRSPRLLAFNGKTVAARYFNVSTAQINYGRQPDTIGQTAIYVCCSSRRPTGIGLARRGKS
jgi:double-stranded uracil-DNA glycosylase